MAGGYDAQISSVQRGTPSVTAEVGTGVWPILRAKIDKSSHANERRLCRASDNDETSALGIAFTASENTPGGHVASAQVNTQQYVGER
jgi:hypothetical protein